MRQDGCKFKSLSGQPTDLGTHCVKILKIKTWGQTSVGRLGVQLSGLNERRKKKKSKAEEARAPEERREEGREVGRGEMWSGGREGGGK